MKKSGAPNRFLLLVLSVICLVSACVLPAFADEPEDPTEPEPAEAPAEQDPQPVAPAVPVITFKYFGDFHVAVIFEYDSSAALEYAINGRSFTESGVAPLILDLKLPQSSGIYITACAVKDDIPSGEAVLSIPGYAQPANDFLRIVNPAWGAHFFSDVPVDAWYKTDLTRLMKSGAVNGMTQTIFEPDGVMTVAQYTKMLLCTMYSEDMIKAYYGGSGPWYKPYMDFAALVLHYDGLLSMEDADRPITRYEMAALLARAFQKYVRPNRYNAVLSDANPDAIADFAEIPEEYREAVLVAYSTGMLKGVDESGTFDGASSLTRCQACTSVVRLFDKI